MQKIAIIFTALAFLTISCQSEKKEKEDKGGIKIGTKKEEVSAFDTGKTIFNGKGKCYTCHKIQQKSIGPGVVEIVKIYQEQNADLVAFLKQEAEPIVDPENYAVMKTNFAVIKNFSDEELKAIETYMIAAGEGKTE
ncbi:c-type cytochrome [Aquimarina algicola]|uniref:C-type cytochrome n=1 Tax=Aquimarina algicola TaxID=2589995 RepID=A0A504IZS7_9FLAO|nr:c-type cytochrome [Aquimarina algicola]TPN84046.1 c-type cytochrome [Aquimarina algicola]